MTFLVASRWSKSALKIQVYDNFVLTLLQKFYWPCHDFTQVGLNVLQGLLSLWFDQLSIAKLKLCPKYQVALVLQSP